MMGSEQDNDEGTNNLNRQQSSVNTFQRIFEIVVISCIEHAKYYFHLCPNTLELEILDEN